MSTRIHNLSIGLSIGSEQLILQSDAIPSAKSVAIAAAQGATTVADQAASMATSYSEQLKDLMLNLSFKMEKGKVITVALEDFFAAIADKIGDTGIKELQSFFTAVAGVAEGIEIDLWDLSFTTSKIVGDTPPTAEKGKLSFTFSVRANLTDDFYNMISVPDAITNLLAVRNLGLGIGYDQEFAITSTPITS
ncbi:MAG: hypothetical protein ACRBG0_19740 [Lewinella sp.]|uniref:hypothetical protein n=1 Tax=Lewinella sp. TaxID=2004506 RepID=UPI003D6A927C